MDATVKLVALRVLCLSFLLWVPALAQTITASLEGIVQDTTGAVIPGAKVRIMNAATNIEIPLASGAEGRFVAPALPAGAYTIVIEAAGFKRLHRTGVELRVNQAARIEFVLEIGQVSESVEVTGQPPLLETTTSAVGQVVDNKRIVDLPLNQRNPYALIFLVPGVVGSTSFNFIPASNFSVNGGRHGSNEILLDGIPSAPSQDMRNSPAVFPSVDAVQEFRVQTNNYSAEFGRSGGGVINLIYKSGTNTLHGSAFEFLRNSVLDSNDFFANSRGVPLASFKRNQFGGSLGGPVFLPKLYNGRNRTFFFASYEGLRERAAQNFISTMPSALERAGDFSQSRNVPGRVVTIYDPATTTSSGNAFTRQPFPQNRIPDARIDPVARNLLKYYPMPNGPGNVNTAINNYAASGANRQTSDQGDIKVDHNFTDKHRLAMRYSRRFWEVPGISYLPEPFNFAEPPTSVSTNGNSAALDYNWSKSPSFLVNFRYGFARVLWRVSVRSQGFDPTTLGLPSSIREQADNLTLPGFGPAGYYRIGHGNALSVGRVGFDTHTWQFANTKVMSRHLLRFGFEARNLLQNTSQVGRSSGDFSFPVSFTQGPNPLQASIDAGNGFASFLVGLGTGTVTKGFKIVSTQNSYWAGYLADDWKVTSRLTLNIGLRYETEIPRTERYNRTNFFDRHVPHPLAGPSGIADLRGGLVFVGVNGASRRPIPTDANNFSPRFGFAFQANRDTVIRGAYGIFYGPSPVQGAGTIGQTGYRTDTPFRGSNDGVTPYAYLRNPFPDGFLPLTGNSLGLMTFVGQGISATLPDTASPYTQNWNFGVQRQLPGAIVVDASYVGTRGIQLGDQGVTQNQLRIEDLALGPQLIQNVRNPFFGLIDSGPLAGMNVQRRFLMRAFPQFDGVGAIYYSGASSNYHSFQLKAEKRFQQIGFLVAYTNAKLIDDASRTDSNSGLEGTRQNYFDRHSERSVSPYDVSQRLVSSFVYELPFGRGKSLGKGWSRPLDAVVGGWQINGIATLQTGVPLTLSAPNTSQAFNSGLRPNNNGKSAELAGPVNQRLNRYFDISVFSQPATYTLGNLSRTLPDVRTNGTRNWDLSLFKNFRFRERATAEFRAEFFNMFNTPQFGTPGTGFNSAAFGVIAGQANTPRQIQFGLKLLF